MTDARSESSVTRGSAEFIASQTESVAATKSVKTVDAEKFADPTATVLTSSDALLETVNQLTDASPTPNVVKTKFADQAKEVTTLVEILVRTSSAVEMPSASRTSTVPFASVWKDMLAILSIKGRAASKPTASNTRTVQRAGSVTSTSVLIHA